MIKSILIAPGPFKEATSAAVSADCIERGLRHALPNVEMRKLPLCDGGSGFIDTILERKGGSKVFCTVKGPLGDPVPGAFGLIAQAETRIGVIESAVAAGLALIPPKRRNPEVTSSEGVGELIRAVLDEGVTEVIVGCGDTGTSDGGCGMARALGVRFLDARGNELPPGGTALTNLDRIDLTGLDPRLSKVTVIGAVNPRSTLCGARGTARLFGPQKGASWEGVLRIEAGLENLARVIREQLHLDLAKVPGGGGAGGLGAGLQGFTGARLTDRMSLVFDLVEFDRHLAEVDLVVTGEGQLDGTSVGKVVGYVARRARDFQIPSIAMIGGSQGTPAEWGINLDVAFPICPGPISIEEAIAHATQNMEDAARRLGAVLAIGRRLGRMRVRSQKARTSHCVPPRWEAA